MTIRISRGRGRYPLWCGCSYCGNGAADLEVILTDFTGADRVYGEWIDVDRFWGNTGTIEACGNKCQLTLFVQEEWGTDMDAILSNMGDETKLDYRRACDEIFGNG